jgi:hypothetical protein
MKLSLYFLFYVAMMLELLIFIVDRDLAEEKLKESYGRFARAQAQVLHISGPHTITVVRGKEIANPISVTGFWNDGEKKGLRAIIDGREYRVGGVDTVMLHEKLRLVPDTTTGGFSFAIAGSTKGSSEVTISAVLHRSLRDFPREVRNMIWERVLQRDRLGEDSLVVHGNTISIRIEVVEKGEKNLQSGKQMGG